MNRPLLAATLSVLLSLPAARGQDAPPPKGEPEKKTEPRAELKPYRHEGLGLSLSVPSDMELDQEVEPPADLKKEGSSLLVVFSAPPTNGFAANVIVLLQALEGTQQAYLDKTAAEVKELNGKVLKETRLIRSGREAVLLEFETQVEGHDVRAINLSIFDEKRVVTTSCTTLKQGWKDVEKVFRACLDSVVLVAAKKPDDKKPDDKAPEGKKPDDKKPDDKAPEGKEKLPLKRYVNAAWGFSVAFPKIWAISKENKEAKVLKEGEGEPLVFAAAEASNGFSANVNVMAQAFSGTRKEYCDANKKELERLGWKIGAETNTTVSGKDAVVFDFEATTSGYDLRFLALAVFEKDRVLLVTCTGLQSEWKDLEKTFRACLDSFKLEGAAKPDDKKPDDKKPDDKKPDDKKPDDKKSDGF